MKTSARRPAAGTPARPSEGPRRTYGDLVQQYLALRDQHPGVILLFRVGSFYEILFDDAELVARELGLKLGERPSGGTADPVAQCGFAHHALDNFLSRLVQRGYRVAVCDESDAPGEGVRDRDVVRTLTPGTVTDPRLLREDRQTYLAAIVTSGDEVALAWTDLAAGEFKVAQLDLEGAAAELHRLDPAEILVPRDIVAPERLTARRLVTPVPPVDGASQTMREAFPDARLGELPLAADAAGVVVRYLRETSREPVLPIDAPSLGDDDAMRLDPATQRHLELVETEHGRRREGSLLATLDRTSTAMGARMLRSWLLRPLTGLGKIAARQRIIAELVERDGLRRGLRDCLASFADLERLAGRAAAGRASLDDLRALASMAGALDRTHRQVSEAHSAFLGRLGRPRRPLVEFARRAEAVLAGEGSSTEIVPVASAALAAATARLADATGWQRTYLERVRRQPGLARVRLERSTTQGIFLEVPVNTRVPSDWIRRSGLQKVERYTTDALERHAIELAHAEQLVESETAAIVRELRAAATDAANEARDLARHLAAADALVALADVAAERGWCRPVVDDGAELRIVGGRHPVLETDGDYQPNDARLVADGANDQVVVLTGPNMAGKSTWMRQIGLIVLLAQVGSYVPAESARVGRVDAIFTRIGAVDDVSRGHSTFMVEMLETASVLRGATSGSLVLLDEIGRGTSTHDGMAIAWAVIEHLVAGPARPRAVVATHYHELAALVRVYPSVTLLRAEVEERRGEIAFPHRIAPGAADRSYGIEVARLAGLPPSVVARARAVADAIEPFSADIAQRLGNHQSDGEAAPA